MKQDPESIFLRELAADAAEDPEKLNPEELLGPWELKFPSQSFGDMWVELDLDARVSCSKKFGKGFTWYAIRRGDDWELHIILKDKIDRPLFFVGETFMDEVKGLSIAGDVNGPPKLGEQQFGGVKIGEFTGFKLDC